MFDDHAPGPPLPPCPLRLVLRAGAARVGPGDGAAADAPAGWELPGRDPARWLVDLAPLAAAWPLTSLALWVLPRSRADRTPAGLLVVLPGPAADPADASVRPPRDAAARAGSAGRDGLLARGVLPRPGGLARPWRRRGRLWLPRDGALEPDVAADELDALLPAGALVAWHPAAGLVAFGPEERRSVTDLVRPPPALAVAHARLPAAGPEARVERVELVDPPTTEDAVALPLGEDGPGIAEAPPGAAPPDPRDARAGGWFTEQTARFVSWVTGAERPREAPPRTGAAPAQPPRPGGAAPPAAGARPGAGGAGAGGPGAGGPGAGGPSAVGPSAVGPGAGAGAGDAGEPGWLDRLRGWSRETLDAIERRRRGELERLLDLLGRDPDQGLRYALPLTGEGALGRAPPGSTLTPRDVDYRPPEQGPRGPGDPWALPPDVHAALVRRYREAAARELRLGRARRAAYIYATLLGDRAAAADALRRGGHPREAAALFLALGQPRAAARCLADAGLLDDAARLFEREGLELEAAEVWERLGRLDLAAAAYRREVAARAARDDALGAAALLEARLGATDEALALLARAWPTHPQAGPCLEARLRLLGERGRHDEARGLLRALRADPARAGRELLVARVAADAARRAPDAAVRHAADDVARVLVGERLPRAAGAEAEALLRVLEALGAGGPPGQAPDPLLARDAARARAQRERREAARRRAAPADGGPATRGVREQGRLRLPAGVTWRAAAGAGPGGAHGLVALGFCGVAPAGAHRPRDRGSARDPGWLLAWQPWDGRPPDLAFWPAAPGSRWADVQALLAPARVSGATSVVRLEPRPSADAPAGPEPDGAPPTAAIARATPIRLPDRGDLPAREVGDPEWVPIGLLAAAADEDGALWTVGDEADGTPWLRRWDARSGRASGERPAIGAEPGRERARLRAGFAPGPAPVAPRWVHPAAAGAWVVAGREVALLVPGRSDPLRDVLDAPVARVAATTTRAGEVLAASFALAGDAHGDGEEDAPDLDVLAPGLDGGRVVVAPRGAARLELGPRFGQGLVAPHLAFVPGGHLVAATADEVRAYPLRDATPGTPRTFAGPGEPLLAVVPLPTAGRVALVTITGEVRLLTLD